MCHFILVLFDVESGWKHRFLALVSILEETNIFCYQPTSIL